VLSKELAPEAVEQALQLILKGQQIFPVRFLLARSPAENRPDANLTEELSRQERRILECLAAGYANKQIARELDLAEATVKTHVRNTLRKIKVANRTQAAIWAISQGMVMRNGPRPISAPEVEIINEVYA
jgi:two-component system, NarL family, nitrate/nitrite response regulator NarL